MILFLSNGAGEDSIAALVIRQLRLLRPDPEVLAMPLLGAGHAYPADVERVGVEAPPPSLGLSNESWRLLVRDLRHGLVARIVRQLGRLRGFRPELTVAVGDLVPVCLAGLSGRGPALFVGTAKSSHHHPYSWIERLALRRFARHTFTRDALTAADLQRQGLSASCVGNAMMDELATTGLDLGLRHPGLALLPGSRQAAYAELPRLLDVVERLWARTPVEALVGLAEGIDLAQLAAGCPGWTLRVFEATSGVVAQLEHPSVAPVKLIRRGMGDLLAACQVCLGQAGTANEQAAGAGLPVVAMHESARLGWYRGRQQGLLGEALQVVRPERAVDALEQLLRDPAERARRARIGRERMGVPGGSRAMAEHIVGCLA